LGTILGNKCSAVAEIDDRLDTTKGPKIRGCAYLAVAGSSSNTMLHGARLTSLPSGILIHPAVWPQPTWAENWGLCPMGESRVLSSSNTMSLGPRPMPPYQVASIQPFRHNRHGPKIGGGWGCAPFYWEELGLNLTQCGTDRGIPPYQVAS